jgi:hypothetical protein
MKPCLLALIFAAMAAGQTIEGDVVNAVTGAPVAGAYVSTMPMGGSQQPIVKTDASGHFRLAAPAYPNFPLQVVHAGFLRKNWSIPSKAGQPVANPRIQLFPAAVITGKIEDEDGFPVERAQVEAVRYRIVNGEKNLKEFASTQSDDLGQYRLTNLPPGRYWIRVGPGQLVNWDRRYMAEYFPGTLQPEESKRVEVEAGQERGGVDVHLTKYEGVTVAGRVEMPAGVTVSQRMFPVHLQSDRTGLLELFHGVQQSDGSFIIRHVPPGDYTLRAASGNYPPKAGDFLAIQKVRIGEADERNIVLALHEVQPVDLAGTVVTDAGGNPPPMTIGLRALSGPGISTRSNEDGSFVLRGVLPGHYYVQTRPEMKIVNSAIESKSAVAAGYLFSVLLGETEVLQSGFDVGVAPVGPLRIRFSANTIEVSGKLLDASGQPVSGAQLMLISSEPYGEGGANTDADGGFRCSLRQPGQYRVYVMDDQSEWNDADYMSQHENDFPPLTVVNGTNPPVTLRVRMN